MTLPAEIKERCLRLIEYNGNTTKTAQELGVARNTIYYWYDSDPEFRQRFEAAKERHERALVELVEDRAKACLGYVVKVQAKCPESGKPLFEQAMSKEGEPLFHEDGSPVMRPMLVDQLVGANTAVLQAMVNKKIKGVPQQVQQTSFNVNRDASRSPHDDGVDVLIVDPQTGELKPLGSAGLE